jgi:hypothetical protein
MGQEVLHRRRSGARPARWLIDINSLRSIENFAEVWWRVDERWSKERYEKSR